MIIFVSRAVGVTEISEEPVVNVSARISVKWMDKRAPRRQLVRLMLVEHQSGRIYGAAAVKAGLVWPAVQ
jgi:hypothetical protein